MSEGNSSKNCRRAGDNVTVAFHVQNQFNRVNYQPLFEINVHVHPFTKITYCPRKWRKTVTIHRQASTAPKVCMSACRVEESQRFCSFLVYSLSYWVIKGKLLVERKGNLFDWPRISKDFTFRSVWATNIWWEFFCFLLRFSWEAFLYDRITLF